MTPTFHFHFVTLFPETIPTWLSTSILGRAKENGLFSFEVHSLRTYTHDRHRAVDDCAYGGGGGMVLKIEPLVEAVETIQKTLSDRATVVYFSPAGLRLSHEWILSQRPSVPNTTRHFILICGHYEGVDQRFVDGWVDLEISLGDFVLTGGELPALAFVDALVRQVEGVVGGEEAVLKESFSLGASTEKLLEYPHYTRPAEFRGVAVPPVLLSGDHEKIARWRLDQARHRTVERRPDLLSPPG